MPRGVKNTVVEDTILDAAINDDAVEAISDEVAEDVTAEPEVIEDELSEVTEIADEEVLEDTIEDVVESVEDAPEVEPEVVEPISEAITITDEGVTFDKGAMLPIRSSIRVFDNCATANYQRYLGPLYVWNSEVHKDRIRIAMQPDGICIGWVNVADII